MARSHSENVAINASAGFALMLVNSLASMMVRRVFIQMLGMQYASVSTLFTDILHMLALAELGIGSAIAFSLYKPLREGDARRIGALMNFYKRAYRFIAFIVFAAGLCIMPFLHLLVKQVPDIQEDIRLIFLIYLTNSAASYLLAYKQTLLTAAGRRHIIASVNIWFTIIRSVFECLALMLMRNLILYLLIGFVDAVLRNVIIARKADKLYPAMDDYPDERLSKDETRKLFKDVGALSLYKICQVVLTSTDSFVITAAVDRGLMAVGYLGNYRLIFNTINAAYNQFYNAFLPGLGAMAVNASGEHQYKVFKASNFLLFWVTCFCCTSLFCLSVPFVMLWFGGNRFAVSLGIIMAMTLNFYTTAMMRPTNAFRNSNGLFIQGKYRPVFMAIVNLVLDVALVFRFGVVGVLLATSIARLATQTWYDPWLLFRQVFKRDVKEYYLQYAAFLIVTAVCCAATYLLCQLTNAIDNRWLSFIAKMALCVVVPNLIVYALYGDTDDCRDAVSRFRLIGRKLLDTVRRRIKKA